MSDVRARCRVHVTVDVDGGGPYGNEWTVASIHKDAKAAAVDKVRKLINGHGQVVGEPIAHIVITDENV